MFSFVWNLPDNNWNNREQLDDYIGCCRVGNLCFDLFVRCDDVPYLSYDCYVGGVDNGYGYGKDGYPYTYRDGGDWDSLLPELSKESFIATAEKRFRKFITANHLTREANDELHIW